jgi:hypothetical protein
MFNGSAGEDVIKKTIREEFDRAIKQSTLDGIDSQEWESMPFQGLSGGRRCTTVQASSELLRLRSPVPMLTAPAARLPVFCADDVVERATA